jgi:mxaK protein
VVVLSAGLAQWVRRIGIPSDGGEKMAQRLKVFQLMVLLFCLSLAASIWLLVRLYQAGIYNANIEAQSLHESRAADALFANAVYQARHGDMQQSLALYAEALSKGSHTVRKSSYFNSGNLYLSRANQLLEDQGLDAFDQIGPLLALAKESYRETMRLEPAWYEAKYNYELALRLSPLFELKHSKNEQDESDEAETVDGWSSIPGFPRGMP